MQTKINRMADRMRHLTTGLTVLALATGTAQAAGTYWTDADTGDSDWATVGNWSGGVPTTLLDTVINNGGTVYITSDATSNDTGIGAQKQNSIEDIGSGLDGTVIQTAGTWTLPKGGSDGGFIIGLGSQIGIYLLQGGIINCGALKNVDIGWNNSAASGPSYIIQSGTATATYKKLLIAASGSGAKAYYEMNSSGTLNLVSYEMLITTGGSGQQGVFTQTAGTVNITGTHGTSGGVRMGLGAGGGGKAELHLNGGIFFNKNGRFDFYNGAFFDIAGGTLKVENADNGGNPWDAAKLLGISNADWRSYGTMVTAVNWDSLLNFDSTAESGYTLITAVVPAGPSTFQLIITPAISPATGYDLKWESQAGMLYDVLSTADLAEDLVDWDVVEAGIVATPDENTWNVTPVEPSLFYRVIEYPAPPIELFSENFDLASAPTLPAGWESGAYVGDAGTTAWILGIPTGAATGPSTAFSPDNCVGTNIAGNYLIDANIWLRTPAIDLTGETGAKVVCQQWVDIDDFNLLDIGTVRILDADDLPGTVTELAVVAANIQGLDPAGWVELSADIPDELGNIVVEFRFQSDNDATEDSSGWYLDDVKVTAAAP